MATINHQTILVRLEPDLARKVRRLVASGAYESVNEFFELAALNQLNADHGAAEAFVASREKTHVNGRAGPPVDLLSRPAPTPPIALATATLEDEPLSVFTNRLSPLKVAVRVLANLASEQWPTLSEFHEHAGRCARDIGLRFKNLPNDRRWIGYPVGEDEEKSLARFVSSFTLTLKDGEAKGPLAILGLASIETDRICLTRDGWRFAAAPSTMLDESTEVGSLSAPEVQILRERIEATDKESKAVAELASLITTTGGVQTQVDAGLRKAHPSWTRDMTVAHRAAIVGRLSDVALVSVIGRGTSARLTWLGDPRDR